MTHVIRMFLNDDDHEDHEARRLILEALNLGANFLTEETKQPFSIFKDHKTLIGYGQLQNTYVAIAEIIRRSELAARKYPMEVTMAKNRGVKGEELVRLQENANAMQGTICQTTEKLRQVRALINKWLQNIRLQEKALTVGNGALDALSRSEGGVV